MKQKENPKILFVTTPIRPFPSRFPPVGCLSPISALNRAGFHNTEFYNIDLLRPEYKDVVTHILEAKPDIVGISAVVSTAYEYSKRLSLDIKRLLPETTIILGGNLGASAEILLKKTGVDFICTGEGERTIIDFVKCWQEAKNRSDYESVKGLAFLDGNGDLINTPYADPIPAEEIYDIDWSIMEDMDHMKYFIHEFEEAVEIYDFSHDPRSYEPHRRKKTLVRVPMTKGCVARCTFCHRWEKGIRFIPVPIVMKRLDFYIEKYNMGFVRVVDENFGSNKKWLLEFIEEVKKRDLLWSVGGMRVSTITSEMIGKMKEAGCTSIFYGMETGSRKMLQVMEKVTTIEQNKNAVKWMAENDLFTIVQLIVGMPGETQETVRETADFAAYFVEQSPKTDPNSLSINFAQALPGTPLYEVARRMGHIGQTLEAEEEYLLKISDRDARDGETTINFTDYPKLYLEKWRFEICNTARNAYIKKWGKKSYFNVVLNSYRFNDLKEVQENIEDKEDSGYFAEPARGKENTLGTVGEEKMEFSDSLVTDSIHDVKETLIIKDQKIPSLISLLRQKSLGSLATFYPQIFWRTRAFTMFFIFLNECRKSGFSYAVKLAAEVIAWKFDQLKRSTTSNDDFGALSLRKVLRKGYFPDIATDHPAMEKLRQGR